MRAVASDGKRKNGGVWGEVGFGRWFVGNSLLHYTTDQVGGFVFANLEASGSDVHLRPLVRRGVGVRVSLGGLLILLLLLLLLHEHGGGEERLSL